MTPLTVPTLNNNDTEAKLQVWLMQDGARVSTGDTVAVLETTKATFDLIAESDGFLKQAVREGDFCPFGSSVGFIAATASELSRPATLGAVGIQSAVRQGEVRITKSARRLMERHSLSEESVSTLGKSVIRTEDVAALVETGPPAPPEVVPAEPSEPRVTLDSEPSETGQLDPRQAGIARLVSRSHQEIPAAFHLKRILVDSSMAALKQLGKQHRTMLGLPELLVWIASRLRPEHPLCFGSLETRGERIAHRKSDTSNIGVTIDIGSGLSIPVVRDARNLDLISISRILMGFRAKAIRGGFEATDLQDGDLSVSLNLSPDTVLVRPLIQWPQVAMLSLSSIMPTIELDPDGQMKPARMVHLGLAYDHRIVNGFSADAFLTAIKEAMEAPQPDRWIESPESA